jgi:hypothetical protein
MTSKVEFGLNQSYNLSRPLNNNNNNYNYPQASSIPTPQNTLANNQMNSMIAFAITNMLTQLISVFKNCSEDKPTESQCCNSNTKCNSQQELNDYGDETFTV